jgi:pyruvate ferredoxin oxidoreductase delta subunit
MIDFEKIKQKVNGKDITIGAVLASDGSTKATKTGAWRSKRPVVNRELCSKCGICWVYCPEGCVKKTAAGFEIDLDYCKGCGICANECPKKSIQMVMEEK